MSKLSLIAVNIQMSSCIGVCSQPSDVFISKVFYQFSAQLNLTTTKLYVLRTFYISLSFNSGKNLILKLIKSIDTIR